MIKIKIVVNEYPFYASDCMFCNYPDDERTCGIDGYSCHLTNSTAQNPTDGNHDKCDKLISFEDMKFFIG